MLASKLGAGEAALMRNDLPRRALTDLPGGAVCLVLCPTARLADSLRHAHGAAQAAHGARVWAALGCATPAQWLDHLVSAALLRGEIPPEALPGSFLTWPQERCLWQQAIAADAELAGAELFDREGMALAAMEAESLRLAWRIEVPAAMQGDEYRAFWRWREWVAERCREQGWLSADQAMAWRIDCVARGVGGLPAQVGIAGFVAADPVLGRLLAVLENRGVEVFGVDFSRGEPGQVFSHGGVDAEDECRAAAAWAHGYLQRWPTARLRIAVADWPQRRAQLEAALDAALHPEALGAGWAGVERRWHCPDGEPLADQALVTTALALLALLAQPRRLALADFGALLCSVGWSADITEADVRAQLEAQLRERLPPETSLERLRRALHRVASEMTTAAAPTLAPRLLEHIDALAVAQRALPARQLPSAWGRTFVDVLAALGWPGERPPLALERLACGQFQEVLTALGRLDAMLGRIDAGAALRLLRQLARDQSCAMPRRLPAAVDICGLDHALAGPRDGLWLLGMNEGLWPRGERPNPLLPAELQRRAGVPAARADSLMAQALELREAYCNSAAEVVFSWAVGEGERRLRPSPLLRDVPVLEVAADELSPAAEAALELVDDAWAPAVAAAEKVRGGTWLLQAQAICPAWGFYQYRLGAAALPAPSFGLDARARGSLLHGALESFWRGRGLADLLAMDAAQRAAEIAHAVAAALAEHDAQALEALAPRLRVLEGERLAAALDVWLEVEARRPAFQVIACEEKQALDIEGLAVTVVIDRVDELADGRLVIIDYKSGRSASADSWAETRIREPQLPIYAALAFPDRAVAAVALARVLGGGDKAPGFLGVAEEDGLLPGVKPLADQGKRYPAEEFPDWMSLRRLWAERIGALAREVRAGAAGVVCRDEADLAYCEIKPLLRLAERRRQFEAGD